MGHVESLGIKRCEAIHYYVHDLQRTRRFYTDSMDFAEVAVSSPDLTARGKQQSVLFSAGDINVLCSAPQGEGGRAWRYLQKHPDGIGTIVFEVADIEHAFTLLDARGGTIIRDIERISDAHGTLATFSITTPLGDTTFRFVQRTGTTPLFPGLDYHATPKGGQNRYGFVAFDHITSNFQTMAPALLWFEHVMGFEPYWKIQFHTDDVAQTQHTTGSGLRSMVMVDRASGMKFANNEPMRPFFTSSQINIFGEQHRGDGVQHVALSVFDIIHAVRGLRAHHIEFMPTPNAYYDMLPEHLNRLGVKQIDEDPAILRELGILVDGETEHRYLLQIFLKDAASLYHDPKAGPFFFEVIQRKGDKGFGAGNFRALFESIERQQKNDRIVP